MAIRYPLQVRRTAKLDERVEQWNEDAESGRGQEARKSNQRLKALERLEGQFPWKPFLGRNVPKKLIPEGYAKRGVTNLFRSELPDGWRLLYTVMEVDGEQAVVELDAMPHPEYDKLFGYEGR